MKASSIGLLFGYKAA